MRIRTSRAAGLAALCAAWALPAAADDLRAASEIDSVLVFPDSAEITRLGEIAIPAGDHRVIVSGLPRSTNPDSLRVRFGDEAVVVGAVEASEAFPEGGGPDEAQRLRDELQALEDAMQTIDDRIATAELQLQFLESQARAAPVEPGDAIDPAAWPAALAALEDGALEARRVILEARQARRDLEEAADEIKLALERLQNQLSTRTTVEIALTAEEPVTTALELRYQVAEAGWAALYEARLDSEAASMMLERKIKVFQSSGEDWNDVRLAVSTAPPTDQLSAPTVDTQYLDLLPPAPPPAPVAAAGEAALRRERADMAYADMDEAEEIVVTGSRLRAIETVDASFASTYAVGGRVDVLSDGLERTFTIGQEDIDVDLVIRTAPRWSLDAFVTAKLTYEGSGPLPAGGLRKYRDGAYLREDRLDTLIPGEEIELGFGVDQAVVVTWVDEGEGRSEAGLIGRTTVIDEDHRFEALNRHDRPFTVEIVDFRPVPQDDDITVRVDSGSTPPDEEGFQDAPGVIVWRRALEPGETLAVRNAYTISYPTSERLVRR